jgi:hypothetical protein
MRRTPAAALSTPTWLQTSRSCAIPLETISARIVLGLVRQRQSYRIWHDLHSET